MAVITNTYRRAYKGVGFLVSSLFILSIQDAFIKLLSTDYPVHEIVLVRSLVAILALLIMANFAGGLRSLKTKKLGAHIMRSLVLFTAYTSFYLGLASLHLAEAVTLFLSAPLFITLLSAQLLNEKVDPSCWIAVTIGFGGVVLMLKPGAAIFDLAALLPLIASLSYAIVAILTRRLGQTESGISMAFYPTVIYILLSSVIGLFLHNGWGVADHPSIAFLLQSWAILTPKDVALLVLIGIGSAMGFYFISQAYRLGQPVAIAPFEYVSVPLSLLWGFIFWREVPELESFLGMLFIVGSGLYILGGEALNGGRYVLSIFKIRLRR